MATQDTYSAATDLAAEVPAATTLERPHGQLARWRERTAERKRRRLVSPRRRRALAHGLRRTAASTHPPTRFDVCPILLDRVTPLRIDLLQIADALDQTRNPDPTAVALIHVLLTDGRSPLYNQGVPSADLHFALSRARAGLAAQPHT
jgi:hypothetical protein